MQLAVIDNKTQTMRILKPRYMQLQDSRRVCVELAAYSFAGATELKVADVEGARAFDYSKPEVDESLLEDFSISAILTSVVINH